MDQPAEHTSTTPSELSHESAEDTALLHLLNGYYIKRHTVNPWNTSGGYCDVFTGDHPVFGKVALKRPRMSGDQCTGSQLRNFRSEAHIWKELRHRNILQFVGLIDTANHIWLISAFAENGTLHEYILRYPEVDRYSLVLQFTSGLAYLHSKNVVHGDLKSPNLLVSARHKVLIADFGLSKLQGMTTNTSRKGAGSVRWMAPELLDEECATKTFSTDVYAYGITISEILRGEMPFNQYANEFALLKAMSVNYLRPPALPRESPQGKSYAIPWAVAEDCWDPTPSKRPSMVDICRRFTLDYTEGVADAIPDDALHANDSNQVQGMNERTDAAPSTQPMNFKSANRINPSIDANDTRLLHLLGDAEYGDIGHLVDDGLCLEGTRVEILDALDAWSDHQSSSRIMLLKGQAGRGKSTIARSVSARFRKRWGDNASLGIFHFRRNNEALNNRPLRALARQLGSSGNQRVRMAILKAIQGHTDIAHLRLEEQFEILLVRSLKALEPNPPRVLLVIDALDECSDHSLMSALLRLVREHATSLPSTVKFLLTSRPEEHVVRPLSASFDGAQEDLDAVDVALIDRDVRAYFTTRLSEIRRDFGFEAAWAPLGAIDELVSLSQGLFQWAHAAMEYVRERPRPNLQRLISSPTVALGLPALYQEILSTAFPIRKEINDNDNLAALIQHVIGSLVVARRPMSPTVLEYLWDCRPGYSPLSDPAIEIREGILGCLGSILLLPSSPDGPIHFMHASVRDFFINPAQCEDTRFLVDPATHHARLAAISFNRLKRDLKHDICQINNPSKMNSEVLNLTDLHIPSGLRYCCRSWSTHLSGTLGDEASLCKNLGEQLDEFCKEQILHWLEVLSLIGSLSEVFDIVHQAQQWVANTKAPYTQAGALTPSLLSDTGDFCRRFFRLMSSNAQHVTLSCLLHFPSDTALRKVYGTAVGRQVPRIIRGPTLHRSDVYSIIHTERELKCVAFSSDRKTLAWGLGDGTVQLWNTDTGEAKGKPLIGHTCWVNSVAFSPDGETLASGSKDRTIRLWFVDTGAPRGEPLIGHTHWVTSIAFSPDGKTLASGSSDTTIQLWNVEAGEPHRKPLTGHTDWVCSVAFSPDGKVLASGSRDGTIRLWTGDTWKQKGMPLVGRFGHWITSIAFSPDSESLASGSSDRMIHLWTVATGEKKGDPLVGHTNWVASVAFSPDGRTLASGSYDTTIRLWTVATGQPEGKPLVGHTGWVISVAVSLDGKIVASGSYDKTIRVWALTTGEAKEELLTGHTARVISVSLSPDGKSFASISDDETIRLWNADTGTQKEVLHDVLTELIYPAANEHIDGRPRAMEPEPWEEPREPIKTSASSVEFSSDGKTLKVEFRSGTTRHWRISQGETTGLTMPADQEKRQGLVDNASGYTPAVSLVGQSRSAPPEADTSRFFETSDLRPNGRHINRIDATEGGWVFIHGKRRLWLPESFYLYNGTEVGVALFGRFLILLHPNIHILDVSPFL